MSRQRRRQRAINRNERSYSASMWAIDSLNRGHRTTWAAVEQHDAAKMEVFVTMADIPLVTHPSSNAAAPIE